MKVAKLVSLKKLAEKTLRRDQSCVGCGRKAVLSVYRITPISRGGTNTIDNFIVLCDGCVSTIRKGRRFLDPEINNSELSVRLDCGLDLSTSKKSKTEVKEPVPDTHWTKCKGPELKGIEHCGKPKMEGAHLCAKCLSKRVKILKKGKENE